MYYDKAYDTNTCLAAGDGVRGKSGRFVWMEGRSSPLFGGTGFFGGTMGPAGLAGFSGKGLTTSEKQTTNIYKYIYIYVLR